MIYPQKYQDQFQIDKTMMKVTTILLLCLFLANLVWLIPAQEVEDEREFSYDENSEVGPAHWGDLHEEWKECGEGKMQSPIDMANQRVQIVSHLGRLKRSYKPSNATLINRGHDVMIRWPNGAGYIVINGTRYQLNQVHWHSPSEHAINGKRFDMEVHLVHQSNDSRIAVFGIMYKLGRPDSFLSMMKRNLEAIAETRNAEKTVGIVDPRLIKLGSRKYYRYQGSLTTPPCTQNVIWTILKKVRTVSKEQLVLFHNAVHDESEGNARPTQAIHERPVHLFRPNDDNHN